MSPFAGAGPGGAACRERRWGVRVLVIENQQALLGAVRNCLKEEGFQVDAAAESEEADYKARSVEYDLIILSLLLARDQAFGLLRSWRPAGVSCPVLAVAASGDEAERVQCLELGADDYLP